MAALKKPNRASKPEKAAKRAVVARGVAAGKNTRAIAREAKCSQRHVQRLSEEPETKLLIAETLRPHHKRLVKLVERALIAIERGLKAKKKTTEDHFTQLRATERVAQYAELAQGGAATAETGGEVLLTWEQLCTLMKAKEKNGKAKSRRSK